MQYRMQYRRDIGGFLRIWYRIVGGPATKKSFVARCVAQRESTSVIPHTRIDYVRGIRYVSCHIRMRACTYIDDSSWMSPFCYLGGVFFVLWYVEAKMANSTLRVIQNGV